MRAMGISDVEGFPFPTPPPKPAISRALSLLVNIGAIAKPVITSHKSTYMFNAGHGSNQVSTKQLLRERGYITEMGKLIARFPVK